MKSTILTYRLSLLLVLTSQIFASFAHAQVRETCDVKIAQTIAPKEVAEEGLRFRFNGNRKYVIGLNRGIPGIEATSNRLVTLLPCDQVNEAIFQWMPSGAVDIVKLKIGRQVPIEIAQPIIQVLSQTNIPIQLEVVTEDGLFGNTQRVYIGTVGTINGARLSKVQVSRLLDSSLTQSEFMAILVKSAEVK